ncbi:hypothetical protein B0T10DRAFT_123156 [Thelonectria olida]|uniref:Suppressor of anucleate metulae protein B n=1 Tax=Thelonectria olida TaxID=1576542 RepID=A0A9P8WH95_9HYPO|nr:hypothetical protein B0T10DRAFT_123156 [Thelonectria olida]
MAPPSPIEVRPHPTKGRGLYATKTFSPGETIQAFAPLILVASVEHTECVCSYCLKKRAGPDDLRACSLCHHAYYCNTTCQAAAWSAVHSKECKPLQTTPPDHPELPTPVRAVIQALVKKKIGKALETLEGSIADFEYKSEDWKNQQMMGCAAVKFAGLTVDLEAVNKAVEYLCKIQVNAFQRWDFELGHAAIFLEPTLAMANHSCLPNANVEFVGRKAVLQAETEIRTGDEIEISYTDYTYPLPVRQQALKPYHFTCKCRRCEQDLSIYQACALSPNIELNRASLVLDMTKLKTHAAATNAKKAALANEHSGNTAEIVADRCELPPDTVKENRKMLEKQWQTCKGLVSEGWWAVTPLYQVLSDIALHYVREQRYISALLVTCLVATDADPYRYVAPFHPQRSAKIFLIAKLLALTASEAHIPGDSAEKWTNGPTDGVAAQALDTLKGVDQTSLCQMLLLMVLQNAPAGYVDEWGLALEAKAILNDIDQLQGRERELSLINAWNKDPRSDQSHAFFRYAVVQQVDTLAKLGPKILALDFGQ